MTLQSAILNDTNYIPVLDSGFVGLVDIMGDDALIARAARVSYGTGTKTVREDTGLIRYLMKNEHTSPFEMVEFLFHIKMPIFVARQHIRHRTANVNEYSGRYSEMSSEFYLPEKHRLQGQDHINKQGSAEALDSFDQTDIWEQMQRHQAESFKLYKKLMEPRVTSNNQSLSRELARLVLPVSNYTEMYWKIDLKNLLHYVRLRDDAHAQWEIQQYGQAIGQFVKQRCPIAYQAFQDYVQSSRKLSQGETQLLRDIMSTSNAEEVSAKSALRAMITQAGDEKALCSKYGISAKELLEFLRTLDFRL
tara:strand:- start:1672 stop:2589 length:918 start_codon:yes stop_codon:yes gene_type:complete